MQSVLCRLLLFSVIPLATSCSVIKQLTQPAANITALKYLGNYEIPFNTVYNNTLVGGLSGIDYDQKRNLFYIISDDRSEKNPARFYSAGIYFTGAGIDSIRFTGVTYILQPDGSVYPNSKTDRFNTPDPEGIRYNPVNNQLVWSNEGERAVRGKDTVLINPAVNIVSTAGKYISSFTMPPNLVMHTAAIGPRQNGVLEGLSFADNYKTLFVNIEEPLYEDGPRADITGNNAYIRILKFNVATQKNIAQYAYKLDPVAHSAIPATAFKVNGVPEIMSIGNNKLLVIERSFSTGRLHNTIKIFIADLNAATDVSNISLSGNNNFIPAIKKLVINLDELGIYTDNLEGLTFGPVLPNGNKTLLLIADNNFSTSQKSQLLLFEIIE